MNQEKENKMKKKNELTIPELEKMVLEALEGRSKSSLKSLILSLMSKDDMIFFLEN